MEEVTNLLKECEEKIQKIENETNAFNKEYLKEKGEFLKIVRSDFLTGGIIASSLFIIISSLFNFIGIVFPYDLLIGIFGFLIGLIILIVPVTKPKFRFLKFNNRAFKIVSEFKNDVCQRVKNIKYNFIRINRKFDLDTTINIEEEFKAFQNQLYNLYKEGVEGLSQLKKQSPESIHEKISKINRKYTKTFEKVHNSTILSILYFKYMLTKTLKGVELEKEERKKIWREIFKEKLKYIKMFKRKLGKE
ncbi:hypothetical protein LCGC14_0550130 [marine sediment metagenome]|uniref:Uncharacterized protein n=1 Tax=marine sediment metagenome TaxID=412755 RepID=A0A0F9UBK8_9ZZZZ